MVWPVETVYRLVQTMGVPWEAWARTGMTWAEERQELHRLLEALVWQARGEQKEMVDEGR